jgi:hypothetical protein
VVAGNGKKGRQASCLSKQRIVGDNCSLPFNARKGRVAHLTAYLEATVCLRVYVGFLPTALDLLRASDNPGGSQVCNISHGWEATEALHMHAPLPKK